jgi:hypothetical protein
MSTRPCVHSPLLYPVELHMQCTVGQLCISEPTWTPTFWCNLMGFGANNKKLCATQPRLPKDLSISNVVTVRSFGHVASKTETRGLRSCTSVAVKDVIADLKVAKNLAQRLRHRTSSTSAYSHTYDDHDDSWNPISSRDAEVEALEQGSGNSTTRQRVAVVIPVSYASLREAMQERERQGRRTRGGRRTREVVGGGRGERLMENSILRALQEGLYIVGRGAPLPPPQGT